MKPKPIDKTNKGEKLRNLRLSYGISQREFGEKLGLARGAINSYEQGQNPVPNSLIWKINQAIGIGNEYFETDMTLQEAFDKYNIKPSDMIRMSDFDEISCFVYESIENYAKNNPVAKDFSLKLQFLMLLFGLNQKTTYHFIKVNNAASEPFASSGDILITLKDMPPTNGDFVITNFQQSHIIFQYFISGIDEVLFKGSNGIEIKLNGDEIAKIEILGVIRKKITASM